MDDAILIERYRNGDEAAFTELLALHAPSVYRYTRRYTGNSAHADDLTQEVFVKVWRTIATFDTSRPFRPWLFAVAKNVCIDWLRKERVGTVLPFEEGFEPAVAAKMAESADANTALARLEAIDRTIVTMRIEGWEFKEIGKRLEKPLNTVKSRYRRALKSLQKFF